MKKILWGTLILMAATLPLLGQGNITTGHSQRARSVVLENVIAGEELTNQRHLYQSLVGVLGGQGHVTLLLERWRRPLKASRSFR
jgi:hypothetical protein